MDWIAKLLRLPFVKGLWARFPVGDLALRVQYGVFRAYPQYGYGVYQAAMLASRLKIPRISVIEFGVAGGRGLIALEKISAEVEKTLGVGIDVLGFDTGEGMPEASDYRDLPHVWGKGFYKMDRALLEAKLTRAKLILGDIGATAKKWVTSPDIAPIGFVAFDLDYYTSTVKAFEIFEGPTATHLPRVYCYFDDTHGPEIACMNDYVGELLAIQEFNDKHQHRKICQIRNLRLCRSHPEMFVELMYAFHDFEHPLYTANITPPTDEARQLPL